MKGMNTVLEIFPTERIHYSIYPHTENRVSAGKKEEVKEEEEKEDDDEEEEE